MPTPGVVSAPVLPTPVEPTARGPVVVGDVEVVDVEPGLDDTVEDVGLDPRAAPPGAAVVPDVPGEPLVELPAALPIVLLEPVPVPGDVGELAPRPVVPTLVGELILPG